MSQIPFTRRRTEAEREAAIRAAVRNVETLPSTAHHARLAEPGDERDFLTFLQYPEVRDWIYSLPRPLTLETVRGLIVREMAARERGEGLLWLNFDAEGRVSGYSELRVWPQWAAGELAGAMRPDLQNKGQGAAGMMRTFTWMFEALDLDLICNTTALDNVRIQALFRKTGFVHKGDIESERPDGTRRASQVWEVTRDTWFAKLGEGG
ncbi:GNAT family N-acetyltransferase [Henriciella aquimarina]|uniref:GNAT family N-acetyltransferase n=1 Tax=Henriciella aquimarina TaxID=545261 RepID=UPI000A03A370|nr:GNAT family N-acetyltransferase [Henriciella aquimarina]